MKTVLFMFSLLLINAMGYGQTVTGFVKDQQGLALNGATVSLKKSSDSSVIKLAVSNKEGLYRFESIPGGKYFVSTSFIGHSQNSTSSIHVESSDVVLKDIILTKASGQMKEVTITAKKPPVEVRADKMILNVEGSTNAVGQDALELLRKSPGVMVDKDEISA